MVLGPLAALYASSFVALDRVWRIDPNYSHGWLVVAASLFFGWRAWHRGGPPWQSRVRIPEFVLGCSLLAIGLAMHFLASFFGMLLLDVVALIVILRAVLLVLGGRAAVRTYGFACLFPIFMAPLPVAWYQPLANVMQHLVTSISAWTLNAAGVPVFAEGYVLRLPGHSVEMAEACSGLRQLTAFLALAVAIGHLTGRAFWFRAALVALSGFVALAANCVRVVLTVLVLVFAGQRWAQGTFHTVEGLVVVAIGLLMLAAAAWGLCVLEARLRPAAFAARPECVAGE
jgi:exosortase